MAPGVLCSSCSGSSSGMSPISSPGSRTPSEDPSDFAGLGPAAESMDGSNHHNFNNGQGPANASNGTDNGIPSSKTMPIAIVGMACRLPGNVASPAEFWELCSRARSGYSAVPKERFNHEAFYHPNPGKSGAYHAAGGYFLNEDVAAFDAPFFGLTEKEAISMDPQQRLLLECTFEALENAGIPKHSIVGQDVGVFIGGSLAEYESHLSRDSDSIAMHQATGCAHAMQSNRLSHYFDLRGPSFTADTACSASLTSVHLACQSLRLGESKQAIVGSCHLNLLPESWISFSTCRLLSDTGKSIAFDGRGTGFGRGEGCGIVILKPLDQAIADKDSIRAVILGSGINQDGKTPGITMPNGSAQETLINQVYRNAGLDPLDCGFVEAHGTGTKVGDPIEATALHNTIGQGRTVKDPLYLGSVKSNIGHLEAASGIAAVIKATLMLERGFLLPNHDFKKPNEKIPWKEWNMKVPPMQRPWPKSKKYISVNNFGFGGTNAHVVLGKAPFPPKASTNLSLPERPAQSGRKLFVLSANDKHSLEAVLKNLGIYLEQRPEIFQLDLLNNLAYTLGQRRSQLQWKAAIPAVTSFDLIEALNTNKYAPGKETEPLRIGFIFTGQGAQWYGMGRELYDQYPTYTAAIDRADSCLRRLGANWSLLEELSRDAKTSKVSEAHISQPSCTAVQLALTDLLLSWGVRPVAVAGHSSGEIGAAYAAGILSFDSAMAIAYHRGRLIPLLKERFPKLDGAMMAVGATKEDIQPIIDGLQEQQVRIACYNSHSSLTISGDSAALTELEEAIEKTQPDTFRRRLQVDVAYHSHHMNLVAKEYRGSICKLPQPKKGSHVRFHSSLHGHLISGTECDASYWVDNLTCPVRFAEALETMVEPVGDHKTGVNMLIELGPHSALQGPIRQVLKVVGGGAEKLPYGSPLIRKKDAVETVLDLAGALITKGAQLQMEAINFPRPTKTSLLTDLPRYAWNHQTKYWQDSRMSLMHKNRPLARNDLIGLEAIYSNPLEPTWRNIVCLDDLPWLRHHRIQSVTIFPLSGYITMAIEAAAQSAQRKELQFDKFELKDVSVIKPLAFSNTDVEMTITLRQHREAALVEEWSSFSICSWTEASGWAEHCVGLIATQNHDSNDVDSAKQKLNARYENDQIMSITKGPDVQSIGEASMYDSLSKLGVEYGPSFQGISSCKASDTHSVGSITAFDVAQDMPNNYISTTIIHPTVLESMIELYWPILGVGRSAAVNTVYLPSSVERISIPRNITAQMQPGNYLQAYCKADFSTSITEPQPTKVALFATSSTESRDLLIEIDGLTVSPILDGDSELGATPPRELCYKLEWEPLEDKMSTQDGEQVEGSTALNGASSDVSATTLSAFSPDLDIAIIHGDSAYQYLVANGLAIALEKATSKLPDMGRLHDINPNGKVCIVLSEIEEPFLSAPSEDDFAAVQKVLLTAQGVLWVVRGAYESSTSPISNMISGLSRTIRSETLLPIGTLDLDDKDRLEESSAATIISKVFRIAFSGEPSATRELEFMERSGKLFTPRIVHDVDMNEYVHKQTNPSALELQPYGQSGRPMRMELSPLKSLEQPRFVDDALVDAPMADDDVEFEVRAIGVNPRDIAIAKGEAPTGDSQALGVEASGTITRVGSAVKSFNVGDRIAALTIAHGAFATKTRTASSNAFLIPAGVSFEEAAALPIANCTAYYSLIEQARLREGQRLLIHSASGSVGQAAIRLAQRIGAEIFVTVSSSEKKTLLTTRFDIPEDRVFYSRSTAFGAAIRRATDGEGVDVVLNLSTNPSTLRESWACLNRFGCLVDVGRKHGHDSTLRLDTGRADGNASYFSVDMFGLAAERPKVIANIVAEVARLLHDGKIQTLAPATMYSISDVQAAFAAVQDGDRVPGKLVVVPSADDEVMATPSKIQKKILRADSTYVLIGGTGGLGRSMTRWMVANGAGNLVLLSRTGSVTGKVKELIDDMNAEGANVVVRSCNIAEKASVDNLFGTGLEGLPPVRGVVHGAMVLRDVLFEKMTWEDYTTVIESKVQGAWNIHQALQDRKIALDFFVAISSASGAVGNRGQAAYAAANTFLNAFVQHRLSQGLPAVSLDLTAVSDVGYLADMGAERAAEVARNLGSDSICGAEVLALLGAAITGRTAICNHHVITGMRITPSMKPFWTGDAKFKALRVAAEELAAAEAGSNAGVLSPNAALRAAQSLADAEEVVSVGLVNKISAVLMLEPEDMDVTRSLSHYPLDSLVAIEIRNFITREFEANMQVLELLSSGSIQTLTKAVCQKSKLCSGLS